MKYRYILFIACAFLFSPSFTIKAQVSKLEKANVDFHGLKYSDAAKKYLKLVNSGNNSQEVLKNLGHIYYLNSDYVESLKWYEILYTNYGEQIDQVSLLRYAQSLLSTGSNSKAAVIYDKFLKSKGDLNNTFKSAEEYVKIIDNQTDRNLLESLSINSSGIDFGGFLYDGNFYFSSNKNDVINNDVDSWTDSNFLDISSVDYNEADNKFGRVKVLGGKLRTRFHDSSPVITKDGNTMYFTRTSVSLNKKNKGKRIDRLKIYRASKIKGKWDNIEDLSINGESFSTAHPSLSEDEKKLYFASDMPGTLGETDIFCVDVHADGSFGKPQNLGTQVNTSGRESFPFISSENELYFSSDGHFGFGGLDIYYIDLSIENKKLFNIGAPVNGPTDDFSYTINNNTNKGFFSSNREGGKGYDDIYSFTEIRKLKCEQILEGIITDNKTGLPIAGAKVILFSIDFNEIKQVVSDQQGFYSFGQVACGENYYVRAAKEEYQTAEGKVYIEKVSGKTEYPLALEARFRKIELNTDLSKEFDMPLIHFDLDKSLIRRDAETELAKILVVMQQYPNMKVDVRSHTDSRQSVRYNEKLSQARAASTVKWLIKNGISSDRVTSRGYGESQLVNECSDGVKCTEEQHQANRRSEFIVISLKEIHR